jgi:mannose-6-phosphate isomerase
MILTQGVFKLKGVVQHYAWGGYDFIPELLGLKNPDRKPFAEYWLGAHPNHPAMIYNDGETALSELIRNNGMDVLGKTVVQKFSSLPYLLKVLDVRQMLSIQVHPGKQSAEKGFEEENRKGIPVNAPHRNYKDTNHKPELMVALGDFWLLHGFKTETAVKKILDATPELKGLKDLFRKKGYKDLYEYLMLMEQGKVDEWLRPLAKRLLPLYRDGRLKKEQEDFWAARAMVDFDRGFYDRGIFSVYLFNLLHLKKGEGIFQPEGMPHAYLEGQNVEVMANSDNVLRAGLTDKHIDVAELLKHVAFVPTEPRILKQDKETTHTVYASPAEEFELHRYQLGAGQEDILQTKTAETLILISGSLLVSSPGEKLELQKGEALLITAGEKVSLKALSSLDLFRATVPAI